jgi:P-type E1-E2 ATPase
VVTVVPVTWEVVRGMARGDFGVDIIALPVTLGLAGVSWALSGDQTRALAVLVVATPCPLILAAPSALVAGLSRAAKGGIVLKGGAALEQLAAARTVLLDKTGTLTRGRPAVDRIVTFDGLSETELLRLAPRSISSPRTSWPKDSSTTP